MAPRTPKVTRLDDNAEIYKRRETKSEREKLSELSFAGKVQYIKSYYLPKFFAGMVIVGMIVWILVTVLRPKKEDVLNVAMINYPIELEYIDQMTSDMNEALNVDLETQRVFFDTGFDLLNDDIASLEKISTYLFAGEIDVFIAPESEFLKYAFSNALTPLDDTILPEHFKALEEEGRLFKCKTRLDDEELPQDALGPEGIFGIYIQDLPMFEYFTKESIQSNPPVIGIISTGKNQENSAEFIKYLLNKSNSILNIAMMNYPIESTYIDQMTSDMNEILKVNDEPKKVFFDTKYDLSKESQEKLLNYLNTTGIDVFIAPESEFLKYSFANAMTPLTDLLPSDLLDTSDRLFKCKTRLDDEELPEDAQGPEGTYGIYIQDLPMFKYLTTETKEIDPPVIGVTISGRNQENSVEYIRYLLSLISEK